MKDYFKNLTLNNYCKKWSPILTKDGFTKVIKILCLMGNILCTYGEYDIIRYNGRQHDFGDGMRSIHRWIPIAIAKACLVIPRALYTANAIYRKKKSLWFLPLPHLSAYICQPRRSPYPLPQPTSLYMHGTLLKEES